LTKTLLPFRIVEAALATILIFFVSPFVSSFSGKLATTLGAISLAVIAGLADHDLAVTTQALIEAS